MSSNYPSREIFENFLTFFDNFLLPFSKKDGII